LSRLIRGLRASLPIVEDAEWTMEANPESASPETLAAARAQGVNRLSLGVQSFDATQLRALDRLHDARQARQAVADARAVGFENLNIDLMLGLPGPRSFERWSASLEEAIALEPEHISGYLLTLEPRVPMARRVQQGGLRLPAEGTARRMYRHAQRRLGSAGFEQYEISNWARSGRRCRHHMSVWSGGVYLGLGPGAHGHHDGLRRANCPDLAGYLAALESGQDAPHEVAPVGPAQQREERLLLGLRLRDGIPWSLLEAEMGERRLRRLRLRADPWTRAGWLEDDGKRLRIAQKGLLVSNALVLELIGAVEESE
jgi:oxygen-independent coproporphyrinogen-3 oxidase